MCKGKGNGVTVCARMHTRVLGEKCRKSWGSSTAK